MDGQLYKVQTRFLFRAHIRVKIPASFDDDVFDRLFSVMESFDRQYNSHTAGSYIDRINRNAGRFVEVDEETVSMLEQAVSFSELSDGGYDITVMPLIRLWGFYKDRVTSIPTDQEIAAIRRFVDYRGIDVDGTRARIRKGQEIVTGSFIKAWALDRMVAEMRAMGIDDGIINAGGSTIYALAPDISQAWDVSVADPLDSGKVYTVSLCNQCFSTSSQSQTYVTIAGRRYGHILDPRTGYPSPNRLVCMTSDNCAIGDMASTALFVETAETFSGSMAAISRRYPVEGFLVDASGCCVRSEGAVFREMA